MSKTVLFVVDEPSLFERVESLLAARGVECVHANTPTTAAAALSLMPISAALVDLEFPESQAGELSLQLSALTDAPVRLIARDEAESDESLWAVLRPVLKMRRPAAAAARR